MLCSRTPLMFIGSWPRFFIAIWPRVKCAAAVASLFFVGSKAYRIIRDLGGVIDAAKVLVGAGDLADFTSTAGHAAAAVPGISTIRSACF